MSQPQPYRVGIVGLSPQGRDLLERLSLQPQCELLLYQPPEIASDRSPPVVGVSRITDWRCFLTESELNTVLFLDGLALDPHQFQTALEAGLPVGVLPPLKGKPSRWQPFSSTTPKQLQVLSPHYENPDFRAALAWRQSREGEPLTAIKRVSWVPGLIEPNLTNRVADGWFSQWLWEDVDQLLRLTGTFPESVYAAEFSQDLQRYFLIFKYAGGLVAHLERRRSSVVPLEWGWALTGPTDGFAKQQRYIQTEAGEIYDVPAEPPPPESDPVFAWLTSLIRSEEQESTWSHALDVLRVYHAISRSIESGQSAPF